MSRILEPGATDVEWHTLDLLVWEEEWIASEFAAIMAAAGMPHRVRTATGPRPEAVQITRAFPLDAGCDEPAMTRTCRLTRVRSPP